MKRVLSVFLPLIVCSGVMVAAFQIGANEAQAQMSSAPPSDAGVAAMLVDAGTSAPKPPALHDPTEDPLRDISDLAAAKRLGWGLFALMLGVYLTELVAFLGSKAKTGSFWSKFAPLAKGRTSIVIGGVAACLTAAYNALANGGAWGAVGVTAILAGLAYWHQAGTDPAKS